MLAAPAPHRRRVWIVALAVAAVAAAVALERAQWIAHLRTAGEPERLWIWAAGDPRDAHPTAFYARRDFHLTAVPAAATLTLLGDAEYIVVLNGHRVGSNRYRAGAGLDRYEVAPLLAPGRNRLLVELRSPTGAGGLTARLADGAGGTLAATGPDWAIHREFHRGLVAGGRVPEGERPLVLGREPLGRWGKLVVGAPRPLFESLLTVDAVVHASAVRRGRSGSWDRPSRRYARGPSLGPRVQFDFGAPVVGYLQLTVRGSEPDAALLRFALDEGGAEGPASELVITAREAGVWQDVLPRRFRWVEVEGLEGVTSAGVLPLVASAPATLGGDFGAQPSLLGVESPQLRAPAQDVIRRELEGAPGVGVGEPR